MPATGPSPYFPLFFLALLVIALAVPWYASCDEPLEDLSNHLWVAAILAPFLILITFVLSSYFGIGKRYCLFPELGPNSIHRGAGSPWGVGIFLVLILLMIFLQSESDSEEE